MRNKIFNKLFVFSMIIMLLLSGCSLTPEPIPMDIPSAPVASAPSEAIKPVNPEIAAAFNPSTIPEYNGEPWVYVNNNIPFFTEDEITNESFESYSELDELGRCGVAFACLSPDTQPNGEERGSLSHIRPSGWKVNGQNNNVKYDCVEGAYLYNRCHLIMWALSAENDNALNLITGTRYLNIDGMLPWETKADEYVDETGNHLMYRVTPIYTDDNLVADGVLMEGYSVEDEGSGLSFCVYAYNVQPGVELNYTTGESHYSGVFFDIDAKSVVYDSTAVLAPVEENVKTYVLNTNSKKIHTEDCEFGKSTSEKNKKEFTGAIQELINKGYSRCSSCKPE